MTGAQVGESDRKKRTPHKNSFGTAREICPPASRADKDASGSVRVAQLGGGYQIPGRVRRRLGCSVPCCSLSSCPRQSKMCHLPYLRHLLHLKWSLDSGTWSKCPPWSPALTPTFLGHAGIACVMKVFLKLWRAPAWAGAEAAAYADAPGCPYCTGCRLPKST